MAGWRNFFITFLIVSCLGIPSQLLAEMPGKGFFSLRAGFSDRNFGNNKEDSYSQYDVALTLMLPWQKQFSSGMWIKTGLDFSAGVLSDQGEEVFIGSIGPRVSFRTPGETFSLDIGFNPTYLSDHEFDDEDLGGPLQFISFGGLYAHFWDQYRLGYRYQHMSNANIYKYNGDTNIHLFEVGFLF